MSKGVPSQPCEALSSGTMEAQQASLLNSSLSQDLLWAKHGTAVDGAAEVTVSRQAWGRGGSRGGRKTCLSG